MRADRLAKLHGAVDRQAGESVGVTPYAGGGYVAGAPDPTRPPLAITAEVTEVPKTARATGSGASSGHNAELRAATHTITFARAALPYDLARGDRVALAERGGVVLVVNSVDPFGTGRAIARLEIQPAGVVMSQGSP